MNSRNAEGAEVSQKSQKKNHSYGPCDSDFLL